MRISSANKPAIIMKSKAGDEVLNPDDLVIDREDVPSDESLRLGVNMIGDAAGVYRCC